MHQISTYSVRCYNPNGSGELKDRYFKLDAIGQSDLFEVLRNFISGLQDSYTDLPLERQVYRFSSVNFDDKSRVIHGWMDVGKYGIRSEIIDKNTGAVDFHKAQENAEILKHYFCIFLPTGFNEGIALMHSYEGRGIKTLFHSVFQEYFRSTTAHTLQMNPLAYEAAFAEWQEANTKELRVTKFTGLADIADSLPNMGHSEKELILKAPKKGSLGKLKRYFEPQSDEYNLVEVLSPLGSQVKSVVELEGRRRTFLVGHHASNTVCDIELDESVELDGGVPKLNSIHKWSMALLSEYSVHMYPGLEVL